MAGPEERRRRWQETSPYWVTVSEATRHRVRHRSESAARNAEAIAARLAALLPATGRVLEVASGTGQHVVTFARALPGVSWLPSDPHPAARTSIAAWIAEAGLANVEAPRDVNVAMTGWETETPPALDGIVACNLVQIAPWSACTGLLAGAARGLALRRPLILYGCFIQDGRHLSEENAEFDRSLRHRDPAWGVRDVADVAAAAREMGFGAPRTIAMPADNLMLVLTRSAAVPQRDHDDPPDLFTNPTSAAKASDHTGSCASRTWLRLSSTRNSASGSSAATSRLSWSG